MGLSDCFSPWAVSSVHMRTMYISLMGSTGVPRRPAGIIHQEVSPFMPSDEISQVADLFLHTDQECLADSLCWLSSTCSLSPRKKRSPQLFCWHQSPFSSTLRNEKRCTQGSLPREDTLPSTRRCFLAQGRTPHVTLVAAPQAPSCLHLHGLSTRQPCCD